MMSHINSNIFLLYINDSPNDDLLKGIIEKNFENSTVIIAKDFNSFFKIAKSSKIDVFIIFHQLEDNLTDNILENLRKSKKYQRSVIGLFGNSEKGLRKEQYSSFNVDFVIDEKINILQFKDPLELALAKYKSKIIPEKFNVLVLDDSPEILEIIEGYLNELGHKKYTLCSSIQEASKLIGSYEFDLMLLDWNLPDGTCIDLIEKTRNQGLSQRTKNAKIIVITGRSDVDDIMTLLKYNVTDYIIKPFEYEEFEEKLIYAFEKNKKK